jgi:hypothetical protein
MLYLVLLAAFGPGEGVASKAIETNQVTQSQPRSLDPGQVPSGSDTKARSIADPAQIGQSLGSVRPSLDVSTPSQGRVAPPAVLLGGADACAADRPGVRAPAICARTIERRAAEFERPAPSTLTAEQRLLVEQQTGVVTPADAARQLGADRGRPSEAAQSVAAALSLSAPGPSQSKRPNMPVSSSDPLVEAILKDALAGNPH